MQTETQLRRSAAASLKTAKDAADILLIDIDSLQQNLYEARDVMPRVRKLLEKINKGLHEFNAYHNAVNT